VRPRFAVGLAVVALIWGASFMFIKIMLDQLSPIAVAWIRLGGGGAFILAVVALRGRRLPPLRRWGDVAVVAAFGSALPYMLIPWGERQITAGLAAILNAATPFFAAIFGHLLISSERISPTRAAGLTLGFAGVAVVIGPDLLHVASAGTLGQLAVVAASASYGMGAVYLRRRLLGIDSMVLAGMQSAIAWVMLTPLLIGAGAVPPFPDLTRRVVIAAVALALLSSGVALLIYYWLLSHLHAAQATVVTYLIPVSALFWGWLVLGEVVSLAVVPGVVLILGGIALVNRAPRARAAAVAAAAVDG
jgi:drug/metabolite transporter (DMT)-like permease